MTKHSSIIIKVSRTLLYLMKSKIKHAALFLYIFCLKAVFISLEIIVPKKNDYWCFCTWHEHPHTLDNPRAIFEVIKNEPKIFKIILQKNGGKLAFSDGASCRFVKAESVAGAYFTARSKVILLGYSLKALSSYSNLITKKHCIIQLWHGVPLKKIGMLFPEEKFWLKETNKYSATVCSSNRDKEIMTLVFAPLPKKNVWQTGLPRNDTILKDEHLLPSDYLIDLQVLRSKINGRKMVLYAPTWRKNPSNIYVFTDNELNKLNKILADNNAILAVRGHSNVRSYKLINANSDRSMIINANSIPDVNIVLRLADVLITDYSSIYIDFLLTGKPILHFTYDLESYYAERGFLYDINEAFASKELLSFNELLKNLERTLKGDNFDSLRYMRAKMLFHDHGNQSSIEVVKKIKKLNQHNSIGYL